MRSQRFMYLTLLVVLCGAAIGCNGTTGDPKDAEAILTLQSAEPTTVCIDVDGEQDSSGGAPVLSDSQNNFTFKSTVRGSADSAGSVWNDVVLATVDKVYTMDDGGSAPPARLKDPIAISVKANSTGSGSVTTALAKDIPLYFVNPGRSGRLSLTFYGRTAGGKDVTVSTQMLLGTYNKCGTTGTGK